ncbi:hypothetical protein R5R35_000235 [Gryllus longicercus]
MVYRTINPPVDVTFTFMCKINISHIIIWPQVGNQKSSGFQVSTCNKKSSSTHSFVNVGTGFLKNEPGIIFHHAYEPMNSITSNFLRRRLITRQNSLNAVYAVQIKIMKTNQSSVPAILKVEVWGLPSVSCPKEVRMKVLDLWTNKDKKVDIRKEQKKPEECKLRSTAAALVNQDFEIPEDFLDPITCEIMVLPFILPSGKVVDQRTLEKHENHEANWGRRPSDPFTGKLYTDASKPVLAVALKARIDKFLIDHADVDELKKIPRTVGRKFKSSSSIQGNNEVIAKDDSQIEQNLVKTSVKKACEQIVNIGNEQQRLSINKQKGTCEFSEPTSKKLKLESVSSLNESMQNICSSSSSCSVSGSFRNDPVSSESGPKRTHEELLNDSLDAALKSALSGLPSFTNFTCRNQKVEKKCSFCDEKEVLYILPCQHLLCRMCLMKKTNNKDCKCFCNLPFNSADPKRYFS